MNVDVPMSQDDETRLKVALGRDDIARVAKIVAVAGAMEALDQATGQFVPSTIADQRSYRIYCLFRQGMTLPEAEGLVADLFKVPALAAKRMVTAAVARYSVELNKAVNAAACTMLDGSEWNQDDLRWEVAMPMVFIRNRLLELLSRGKLPDPTQARRGAIWQFPDETYAWLRHELGMPARKIP